LIEYTYTCIGRRTHNLFLFWFLFTYVIFGRQRLTVLIGITTGWTPPNGGLKAGENYCSGGLNEESGKKVLVEYLYLDLQACDRCIGTGDALDEVMTVLEPALQLAGYKVEYKKIEIETEEMAKQHKFLSSPTIRVNGQDICVSVKENNCGCCSEISGTDVEPGV
jgi:glutaredoxin